MEADPDPPFIEHDVRYVVVRRQESEAHDDEQEPDEDPGPITRPIASPPCTDVAGRAARSKSKSDDSEQGRAEAAMIHVYE